MKKGLNPIEEISRICQRFSISLTPQWLYISIEKQKMFCYVQNLRKKVYTVSTAKKGINQMRDSEGTPLGLHEVTDKIGEGVPLGTVFIGRRSTGKIFSAYENWKTKGYVTSRILRLGGLQKGYNLGGDCDTYDRYIYIHGIANEEKIGALCTRGCVGMLNEDVIELFQKVDLGTLVLIHK